VGVKHTRPIKAAYQSFFSWKTENIIKHACDAASNDDLETLSYCLAALSPKHRSGTLTEWLDVIEYAQTLGLEPINWLDKAADVTTLFNPKTSGKHNIYIILLSGLKGKTPGYGLYVGETSKSPADRFNEHAKGKRNRKGPLFSRIVYKHHERLLPTLYSHLNPMSREEAKVLEKEIAEALRLEGIPVFGGH
jgi:hypothetical protein